MQLTVIKWARSAARQRPIGRASRCYSGFKKKRDAMRSELEDVCGEVDARVRGLA